MTIIEAKDVRKVYPLGKVEVEAVKGVSFSIEKGSFISIAGPSGSGKSTILNMIGLIDTPTSGEVFIEGQPISGLKDKQLTTLRHDTIGFIFQSFNLIPVLNVYENVEFPLLLGKEKMKKGERKEWIDFLIEEVGLSQWKNPSLERTLGRTAPARRDRESPRREAVHRHGRRANGEP